MEYTWEQLHDSQDFNHGQVFVKIEDYNSLKERINLSERMMAALWSVSNFVDKPTLITGTLSQYRNKYPVALIGEEKIK